ncbi:MAG: 4Fe-4S binding protein [Candidatus Saelkia tenebricola]|nr:4Fe-4S binding protein [Candidatus Saelkia tenebricola]
MYAKKIVLHFPHSLVNKPILHKLSRDYELEFNILRASITPDEEGLLVLELKGDEPDYKNALEYLKKEGVKVQTLAQDVIMDEEKCTHCGVCVPMCPVLAFHVEPETKKVIFIQDECIACGVCVDICPMNAMEVKI